MTDYRNNASQRERAEALRNDTLHSRQQAMSDLENSGRHARPYDGNWDGPHRYPRLPEASPWHHDPVPNEEPYGVDINEVPVVGEPHEQASLEGDAQQTGANLAGASSAGASSSAPTATAPVSSPLVTRAAGQANAPPAPRANAPAALAKPKPKRRLR
jgi:hypothetical protein